VGSKQAHAGIADAPNSEAEGARGRRIHPLQVVNGDEHRVRIRERDEEGAHRCAQKSLPERVGRSVCAEQRRIDRAALWRWER
jgi:hypothetical protein